MINYWGWVDRTVDGGFIANDYAKGQVIDELPDEVMEVVSLLDLLPVGKQLTGGSRRRMMGSINGNAEPITYFIALEDLKPQEEV